MIQGQINRKQLKQLKEALAQLDLTPNRKRTFMIRLAQQTIAASKRYTERQQTPEGQAWPARKGKRKAKMLTKLPKLLLIKPMPEIQGVRLYLKGGGYHSGTKPIKAGAVGYTQQNGYRFTIRRSDFKAPRDPDKKATKTQAKKLLSLGYKVRKGKKKGWKAPAQKNITGVMSFWQAGLLIRSLSGEMQKSTWTVDLPAREFLGINQADFTQALERVLQGIN
ncbi:phage virion morphogenesis protein [Xenorhabdus bovienii]|uniref:phage virion morphogenesis protein n=1 Tax=Xenorhabdus bovienii TaxID=40576 RepID=UPI0023B226AA|nr:phage virion morphogenesis protein [Xenorhabdus bovienii]MDE9494189.1 phage virion morphogenesis protein [Xenorhabdus bovienii]MDE9502726.1 phage virion morphogenesis protein [Xenorhabdus bovienii]